MFQAQFDQVVVSDLAQRSDSFVEELYQQFLVQLGKSPQAEPSLQPPASLELAELTQAARQAQSATEAALGVVGTEALSGLFRK
jgi:hypothetical protein